ncbi:transglutaminaseTgpA domain-containing protein [Virgibacillus sp. YIM 98842]|uniref:transglutaminase TgpA family protein n=1 Tax=Virgibacillus sp. YIM 98842 TaxID=2663533 RepID=UPI001F0930B0|nr:transglutaminaseTgpA domain-containing protein [Virgibacillus sp. YIM 98842]
MMHMETNKSFLYTSILYVCGFLLFMEWIYPVNDITATSSISVFIIYAVFCFVISMFQLKWWISFLLKGFGLLFIINGLFFEAGLFSRLWFEQGFLEFSYNLSAILSQDWNNLTPMFRSALFLILIWLMSYLLHYWFVVMKRIFLFVMLTFIYVAVLDTFTVYDAGMPMVRTFIIAFIALGIANFMRELNREGIHFRWVKKTPIWLIPLVVTVLFSSVIGYAAPKAPPQWPDPVPFIQSAAQNAGSGNEGGAVQKVGYGEDDTQLGGSFVQDYTPVFQAAASDEHYWRIETKDVYTGKGWEASDGPDYQRMTEGVGLNTFNTGSDGVNTERLESIVEFQDNVSIEKLVYPYGLQQVYAAEATFHIDMFTEAVQTQLNHEVVQLDQYTLSYDKPSFSVDKLREVEHEENPVDERYTQIPENLPDRVADLAVEITEEHDTQYDKAKAVEQYFSSNGFEYETTGVPVPEDDEDYVDQFLFESQIGYCDNFSTSMVVLLRSLDIPARWAKGFTSGEMIEEDVSNTGDSYDVYEVTNANAHSWVEVYFDGVGWVPFEPTQGFNNLSDFHTEMENMEGEQEQENDPLEAPEMEQPELPEQTQEEEEESEAVAGNNTRHFDFAWWHAGLIIAGISIIGFLIYKTRFRWQTYLLKKKLARHQNAAAYQDAYAHLLKLLAHAGLKRDPGQTLREYAKRIDARYSTNEMGQLTAHFEKIIYKNELNEEKTSKLAEVWKNLINRIMT